MPAKCSILVAPASQAGGLYSLQAATCFLTLVLSWSCYYLQFRFLLQTALPAGPLQRPMSTLRSGWLVLRRTSRRLPECPAICVWLVLAAVALSLGDPDGHTSSLCWLPPTCRSSAKWSHYQCRLLAAHTVEAAGRGGPWSSPAPFPPV